MAETLENVFYSKESAASALGCSIATVNRKIKDGELLSKKVKGRVLIAKADLMTAINNRIR